MSLALLTPWQQLLWLVCAFILIVPIISWGVTSIIRGYFGAKEAHYGRIAKAIGNTISKSSGELIKAIEEAQKALKTQEKNE